VRFPSSACVESFEREMVEEKGGKTERLEA